MDARKRILLIGHNFTPEPTGIGKYSGEMMEWLSKKGNDCTVITTYPYYPHWKIQAPYKNGWYKRELVSFPECDEKLTVYRCPLYIPKTLSGINRILHDFSFLFSMFFVVLKLLLFDKSFDYIVTVAPPFHLAYLSIFYRMIKGGKIIYHVQDLQIETAQESKLLKGNRLFNLLYKAEKIILKKCDILSSISQGMIEKIQLKIGRKVIFFPNWAETTNFFPVNDKTGLKENWGYNKNQFICLYSGSIGEKQGLENVIYAAESLRDNAKIQFIICGTGPYKSKLQNIVSNKKLKNVAFLPLQDKKHFNDFLNIADLHLITQKAYIGDLVMPSKLSTILSAGGVSLVTAEKNTYLQKLVERFNVGYVVDQDDHVKLKEIILQISNIDHTEKRINARKYALQYLNIDNVMNQFMDDVSPLPKKEKKNSLSLESQTSAFPEPLVNS
ncbi:MAG TPA: WcaI family glycosyltransferase [Mucilaginibacter sp.]|jgi:colanic acid biosynthesis glycosyl transferase WcaI